MFLGTAIYDNNHNLVEVSDCWEDLGQPIECTGLISHTQGIIVVDQSPGEYTLVAWVAAGNTCSAAKAAYNLKYYYAEAELGRATATPSNPPPPTPVPASTASNGKGEGSSCFIVIAAIGSPLAAQVMVLQEFRDKVLLANVHGRSVVRAYYKYSPPIARFIAQHSAVRALVRWALRPIVILCWLFMAICIVP
jgi:hypothetical protein